MNKAAVRLVAKLLFLQLAVGLCAAFVIAAFAPRLLLLDAEVVSGTKHFFVTGGLLVLVYAMGVTLALVRPLRRTLRALAVGSDAVLPKSLLEVYSLPVRLVVSDTLGVLVASVLSLFAPIRPATNDLRTQAELVLWTLTIVSVASLPFYVLVRASVARVLEHSPPQVAREAVMLLSGRGETIERVKWRLFSAAIASVSFVAFGAVLLVLAHLRAAETLARVSDAVDLVAATLDPAETGTVGRSEAIVEAARQGFVVELSDVPAPFSVTRDEQGGVQVVTRIADGSARVRFRVPHMTERTMPYAVAVLIATALAGALGLLIGRAFSHDVALATRYLGAMGAEDVVRGAAKRAAPRFRSVDALATAIDKLGAIFREFAAAQERAIEARAGTERMRALFLASMSHDLKAPLNAILGFAALVARGRLTPGQAESVAIIEQRGRELLYLIDTILDAARVEAGELTLTREPSLASDIVMAAVLGARDLLGGAKVEITAEVQPGIPRLIVDGERIAQALTAVIMSAVRFAERGLVRVRATLAANQAMLVIDIEAFGPGLVETERERIFEAFQHADRARRHGSLGLGPSLARSIVEFHDGRIEVNSLEGQGTVFHVSLPTERTSMIELPPSSG